MYTVLLSYKHAWWNARTNVPKQNECGKRTRDTPQPLSRKTEISLVRGHVQEGARWKRGRMDPERYEKVKQIRIPTPPSIRYVSKLFNARAGSSCHWCNRLWERKLGYDTENESGGLPRRRPRISEIQLMETLRGTLKNLSTSAFTRLLAPM